MYIVAMSQENLRKKKLTISLIFLRVIKYNKLLILLIVCLKIILIIHFSSISRGACYAGLGQLEIAVQNYERALSIKPEYAKAHYNLGSVLQELGKLHDSVKSYENSIAFEPENAQAHNNLAIVLRELGQLEEAEANCRKAIVLDPEYAEGYCSLCVILYANGDFDSAIQCIEKANSINPKSKTIKLLLAILQARKTQKTFKVSIGNIRKKTNLQSTYLKREVESELIANLYEMKLLELDKLKDPSYGNARGSGYELFEDGRSIIKTVEKDLINIIKEAIKKNIYIDDSFFTILGAGGRVDRH